MHRFGHTSVVLVGVVLFAVLLFVFHGSSDKPLDPLQLGNGTPNTSEESSAFNTTDAKPKEYANNKYKFSLQHPEDLTIKEYDEGGGATTITFQNANTSEGFQIFITPYRNNTITDDQFRQDNPSGVMKEPVEGLLDGVPARMFLSENAVLGETREIWFIKDNHLYEVTTLKQLDLWLQSIMLTWKFQ